MASMLKAAEAGDLARVQDLYTQKVDATKAETVVNALGAVAADKNYPALLDWCFEQGLQIPPNSSNNEIITRSMIGAHIPIFEVLAKHGVKIDDHFHEIHGDALTSAAGDGDVELARWLLEHGHRPDSRAGMDGENAMIRAVVGRVPSLDVLKLLVEHGADINRSGALIAAAEEGNLDAVQYLSETGKVDVEHTEVWYGVTDQESVDAEGSALYRASYKGEIETARYLIQHGADKNAIDKIGRSCRDVAVARGHEGVVKLLDHADGISE